MTLVRTAAARVLEQTGREVVRPRALGQLIDLGFPFTLYDQGPFVGRGISAITLTTAGPRPPSSFGDTPERLNGRRLTEVGRSAQALIGSLDQSLELAQGTQSFVFLGSRFVRGWAIQVSLIAALLPFLLAAVDLFARCRRRHIRIAPALRSLRSRLFFWLWVVLLFIAFSLLGWGEGEPRPLSPESAAATEWPFWSLVAFGLLALAGWLVARDRLLPRRPVTPEDELAGHTAALLALGVVALLVVGTNPFALIFVLPALHAWLWLPQVRFGPAWIRAGVYVAGFAGPLLLLASFARRFELGADAPWYLAKLAAVGYVEPPALLIAGAWLAAAAQLAALTAGRYAPYPAPGERGRRGPIRTLVGTVLGLAVCCRRLAEPQVADTVARGYLAVASRNEDERVCLSRAHDHVGVLAGHRAQHELAVLDRRSGAQELVASGVAVYARGQRAQREPRPRVGRALKGEHGRPDEQLERDERRDRVPGHPEDERLASHAEPQRLARFDRDPPEDLLDPELGADRAHEIVRADGHAARADQNISREPALERVPVRPRLVG